MYLCFDEYFKACFWANYSAINKTWQDVAEWYFVLAIYMDILERSFHIDVMTHSGYERG